MSRSVIIMAGGTGGHIFPGLAVADALRRRGVAVSWLGAAGGMECEKVPEAEIEIDVVPIQGLRGKGLMGWLKLPFRLLRAVSAAAQIFARRRPACAVSFGGYVAGPGGLAARLRGVPLLVHEQNRIPGLTNRTLAKFAQQVFQAFEGAFTDSKVVTCGNPVRRAVSDLPDPDSRWADRDGPVRLLVTGGSQGAQALNDLVPNALAGLPEHLRPLVQHQTGARSLSSTRKRYADLGVDAEVSAFIDDMASAYATADLVVCRAGALTVSELAAAGLGAVLVPFPYAVDDHQTANAQVLVEAGAALVLQERDLDADVLAESLMPLLADRERCLSMARAARSRAQPQAAEQVADACMNWVRT